MEIVCIYFPYTRDPLKKRELVKATGFEPYADQLQSGILPVQAAIRET